MTECRAVFIMLGLVGAFMLGVYGRPGCAGP